MADKSKFAAIIVCGGKGLRMKTNIPKQYIPINGKMIVEHTIDAFKTVEEISKIYLVISKENKKYVQDIDGVKVIDGGDTRQQSVCNALNQINEQEFSHVLIHDGVRPFVSARIIGDVITKLKEGYKSVIPGVMSVDTIKKVSKGRVDITLNREDLYSIQTPQGFGLQEIKHLHQKFSGKNFSDDSLLFEEQNLEVRIVDGDKRNYKITTIEDLERAKRDMRERTNSFKVGQGFDVHQFEEGDGVTLCGVKIPHDKKLKGHSDADVAWHALTDAILGAIGAGDIGEHFSDKDERWKGVNSLKFLQHAYKLAKNKGYRLGNADLTIICEEPKLSKFKEDMKLSTAKALNLSEENINIKATTTEKLGFLGRGEGMAAQAIVCLS